MLIISQPQNSNELIANTLQTITMQTIQLRTLIICCDTAKLILPHSSHNQFYFKWPPTDSCSRLEPSPGSAKYSPPASGGVENWKAPSIIDPPIEKGYDVVFHAIKKSPTTGKWWNAATEPEQKGGRPRPFHHKACSKLKVLFCWKRQRQTKRKTFWIREI